MQTIPEMDMERAGGFAERLFGAALGSADVFTTYLGDRLGLYRALAEGGPATAGQLAERAGIHPRYSREWLEQQAVSGILDVHDPAAGEDVRSYSLPAEHAAALVDPESPFSMAPLARALVSAAMVLPKVLEAFKTGGGVAWADYGSDGIESQGDFNRPWLVSDFATTYLPSVPDVHEKLQRDGARVADVACGVGWASIAIAREYPGVRVDGFDLDESSVSIARRTAANDGLSDRVTFEVADAADPSLQGTYDLVVVIEAIHDLSRPVEALETIRRILAPGGVAIVADEKVAEKFTAPGDDVERFMYAASVLMCLPAGMSEQPSAGTGTVMRPATFTRYATDAGFRSVEVVESIDHPMLRFYRLEP